MAQLSLASLSAPSSFMHRHVNRVCGSHVRLRWTLVTASNNAQHAPSIQLSLDRPLSASLNQRVPLSLVRFSSLRPLNAFRDRLIRKRGATTRCPGVFSSLPRTAYVKRRPTLKTTGYSITDIGSSPLTRLVHNTLCVWTPIWLSCL